MTSILQNYEVIYDDAYPLECVKPNQIIIDGIELIKMCAKNIWSRGYAIVSVQDKCVYNIWYCCISNDCNRCQFDCNDNNAKIIHKARIVRIIIITYFDSMWTFSQHMTSEEYIVYLYHNSVSNSVRKWKLKQTNKTEFDLFI